MTLPERRQPLRPLARLANAPRPPAAEKPKPAKKTAAKKTAAKKTTRKAAEK